MKIIAIECVDYKSLLIVSYSVRTPSNRLVRTFFIEDADGLDSCRYLSKKIVQRLAAFVQKIKKYRDVFP